MAAPPAPLDPKLPLPLPQIIHEAENGTLRPRRLHDTLQRLRLLAAPRDRLPVRLALARPSGLEVEHLRLPRAVAREVLQGLGDELARLGSRDVAVEEGVDVGRDDVDDRADDAGDSRKRAHGLRRRDRAVIPRRLQRALDLGDESREVARGGEMVEDRLVAHDHHLHHPVLPAEMLCDILDLRCGGLDAALVDIDADDEGDAVLRGGGGDVGEAPAVGAVQADGGEALGGDHGDVRCDGAGVLAAAGGSVG